MENRKVAYIYSENLRKECDRLPTMRNRASIVHDLVLSYGLLDNPKLYVVKSLAATEDELKVFHSSSYIEFLSKVNGVQNIEDDFEEFSEEAEEFGLGYDCPIIDRLLDFATSIAGGSLTAAKLLAGDKCEVAINWFGGWHHAQRDSAEGFCYVNDVVLAIHHLLSAGFSKVLYLDLDIHHDSAEGFCYVNDVVLAIHHLLSAGFSKILYLDLDIHHGNGVQNAFEISNKVLTMSFHKFGPGFYPGSGSVSDIGSNKGKYYSINVPFLEGLSSETYLKVFNETFPSVFEAFKPDAVVVQCGADCLCGDDLGECNLTLHTVGECVRKVIQCRNQHFFWGAGATIFQILQGYGLF